MERKKLQIAVGCVAAAAVVGLGGYQLYRATRPPVLETMAKEIVVETQETQTGSLALATDYIGHVQPDESVGIVPKVPGTVAATYFEVGDTVKKGDLLFEIDPQDVQLQVNIAAAAFQATTAQVAQALGSTFDMQLIQTEGSLDASQRQWSTMKKNLDEYDDNYDDQVDAIKGTVKQAEAAMKSAQQDFQLKAEAHKELLAEYIRQHGAWTDQPDSGNLGDWTAVKAAMDAMNSANLSYQAAKKAYQSADGAYSSVLDGYDSNYESLKAAKNSAAIAYDTADRLYELTKNQVRDEATTTAMAQLGQARASYESALKQLEYTKVYAPIDGVVEAKSVQEHNMAANQGPAYVVSNKSMMTVVFNVSADAAGVLAMGDTITVENGAKTYSAVILEIGTKVSETSGLFPVKARIESDDPGLLTGITVKVSAETRKADNAVLIPLDAVYYEQANAYVYLYQDGKAVKTPVTLGLSDQERAQVLAGVKAGDRLITTWNPGLTDGVQVTAADSAAPAGSAQSASSEGAVIIPEAGESGAADK